MNLQRRRLLLSALSLTLVPSAVRSLSMRDVTSTQGRSVVLVRELAVPESGRFAESWRSNFTDVVDFDGDVGSLLYERLVPMWRQHGVTTTAGLTNASALFCLSQVAADFGLRVIYRGMHRCSDGVVQHETHGMQCVVDPEAADWASQVALALERSIREAGRQHALSARELLPERELLTSWLMVPRSHLVA